MEHTPPFLRIAPCAFDVKLAEPKVCWVLTRRCNFACAHCSTTSSAAVKERSDPSRIDATFSELARHRIQRVILSGGEPLLSPDILEIIRRCSALGMRTSLATNGSLLTEDFLRALKEAGLVKVTLSLDGPPDSHDTLRRHHGAYEKAVRAARILAAASQPFSFNCMVRADLSVQALKELFALAKAYRADELSLTFPMLIGRMRQRANTWETTWKDTDRWLRDLATFADAYRQPTIAFVPRCAAASCPSESLVFGQLPGDAPLGACVYLQYAAAEAVETHAPILVPTFHVAVDTP